MQDTTDSESATQSVPTEPASPIERNGRLARAAHLLAMFAGGQAVVQVLNVAAGLILIRVLPKEAYAQFTLGNTVLSILAGLIEFGFAPAILALVAERVHDKQLIGKYVRSACVFRDRLLLVVGPCAGIGLVVLGMRQGWSLTLLLPMALVVMGAAFANGRIAYYSIPLKMHRRARDIYAPQIIGIVCKIAAFISLWALGILGAVLALAVHLTMATVVGRALRRRAITFYDPVKRADPQANRRMLHHLAPMVPMHLFAVLQGNILVILIAIIGSSDNIAEIGALGRLSQLFLFVTAVHSMVVLPWIARTPLNRLFRRYLLAAAFPIAIAAPVVALAFAFPGVLLWVLGPGYYHLRAEVGWMVTAGAIHLVGATLFHINFSRRWLYWWGSLAQIGGVISVQVLGILLLDLSLTMEAVFFALMTNMGLLVVNIAVGIYGFNYGARGGDEPQSAQPPS